MTRNHWLQQFQTRLTGIMRQKSKERRSQRLSRPINTALPAEFLEDRSLMSVSVLLLGGNLQIQSDGDEDITVRSDTSGRVEILTGATERGIALSAFLGGPIVSASLITGLQIEGGSDANDINLSAVTLAAFPNITSISVQGGNGHDRITASIDIASSLNGADGNDTLIGSNVGDTLLGGNGNDTIFGDAVANGTLITAVGLDTQAGGGNDSINAGDGADSVQGLGGNDSIDSGDGNDLTRGGAGDDSVYGDNGADSLTGDAGNDTVNGDGGLDTISGGSGNDVAIGGALADSVNGDDGNDTLLGNSGADTMNGGAGNDRIEGGNQDDLLNGDDGDDLILGSLGNEVIDGGNGNDLIYAGAGADTVNGNNDNDTILGMAGNDNLTGGGDADYLSGGDGSDLVQSGAESPNGGTASNPVLISVTGATVAEGNAGATQLTFVISLSGAVLTPMSVRVDTANGTATGTDYTAISNQIVTFAPGVTTQSVIVSVTGDTTFENNETMRLLLSAPTLGAVLQNSEAVGTITNDDPAPPQIIGFAAGGGQLFNVHTVTAATTPRVNTTPALPTAVDIELLQPNIAIGVDNIPNTPTLFTLDLNTGNRLGTATITNNPGINAQSDIAIIGNSVFIASTGANPALFSINIATSAATNVGNLNVGGANFALDYLASRNGVLYGVPRGIVGANAAFNNALCTINTQTGALSLVGPLGFAVTGPAGAMTYSATTDRFYLLDGASGFLLSIDPTSGAATVAGPTGRQNAVGLLDNNERVSAPAAPTAVQVSDATISEGNQGTSTVSFDVTVGPGAGAVSVTYQTIDGRASSASDYVLSSGTLNFAAGGGTQQVTVTVNGDNSTERDESFFLRLVSATGASITDGEGVGTITNDDAGVLPGFGDIFFGDAGNDTLIGSIGDDTQFGGSGHDSMLGGDGNDSLRGGAGNDTINGGVGDDTVSGQSGIDVLNGGAGDDAVVWELSDGGTDTVSGDSGADRLQVFGTSGSDTISVSANRGELRISSGINSVETSLHVSTVQIFGQAGNDSITIGDLSRTRLFLLEVNGDAGNDAISAASATSLGQVQLRLNGGLGNDLIAGSAGNDTITGGDGVDVIGGRAGNDVILGGLGLDVLRGEDGDDLIYGDEVADTVQGAGSGDADNIDGGAGNDIAHGGGGDDVIAGGVGDDVLSGNDGNDDVSGDDGNDSILGGSGNDSVSGLAGNDTVDGGRNDDSISGNGGDDLLFGDHGNDQINAGDGNNTINAGDGDDTVVATTGADVVFGGDGNDLIDVGDGRDTVSGGDGNDTILGGGGQDILIGRDGDDLINGQGGTDIVAGNEGVDNLVAATSEIDESFIGDRLNDLLISNFGSDFLIRVGTTA